jgi:hypothetical protein
MERSKEVDRRLDQFKEDFGKVMSQMARSIADKMSGNMSNI